MWQLGEVTGKWRPPVEVAQDVLKRLNKYRPWIYRTSRDRKSVYVHFKALPNGLQHKLRISTHDERERYGYKWQLRLDGLGDIEQKRWSRYFADVDSLVKNMTSYYDKVEQSGEPQHETMPGRKEAKINGYKTTDREAQVREGADAAEVERV